MMKKIMAMLLMLAMLGSAAAAGADTVIDVRENRNITINKAGTNTVPEGISPTTGRVLADIEVPEGFKGLAATGVYLPFLVQISNSGGGVGKMSPYGAEYADIIYESTLSSAGATRMTFLFSDLIPTAAGPIRSSRVFHAWLREEWKSAFLFQGVQNGLEETNVDIEFSKYRARLNVGKNSGEGKSEGYYILFDGNAAKDWKAHFSYDGVGGGSNRVVVNVAALLDYIPDAFKSETRPFLFSDAIPETGDRAETINVTWGPAYANSLLEYDSEEGVYYRYMLEDPDAPAEYVDQKTQNPVTFSNVILQNVEMNYPLGVGEAPLPTVTGVGNADYFIGGKHIAGVWQRETMADRTVFYGADGNEITLRPGRTLIIVMDGKTGKRRSVSYQ